MSATATIKSVGATVLGIGAFLAFIAVGIALLTGAAEFSIWILEWTFPAFSIALLFSLFGLVPLALIPQTRGLSAILMMLTSLMFGIILWLWGMAYAYTVWGLFGVIVGLMLFGVGVVPVAIVAALVHADWSTFGILLFAVFVTYGLRGLANWVGQKADERDERLRAVRIIEPAHRLIDQ